MGRRRDDDEISVAELLRETGATPRSLGGPPAAAPFREEDTGDGYRERLEQRAREAAAGQQRAGRRIRWISAFAGAVVVLGSLVVIAVTSGGAQQRQATPQDPLAPATTPRPTTPALSRPSPTPIPSVLRQTSTPASTSAAPKPPPPVAASTCVVRFAVRDQWNDGFTADVTITNKSDQTLSPWTLTWTFTAGQRVTHGWDGKYGQSGSRVTVNAESYNGVLAPGATVSTGLNGAFDHGNPAPTAFTLNGARCDAG
ncbi:Cellulose binding domain-containing protein [Amycolatopsis pretoriensis]|uniref:Cellulose binding domain-containing protein n=1 Tax=Amycolatopsis pretoriensis TaxID=218821 RepID=A0A1H5QF98_9PSEU|nr:cellulose-binding domain-containing protein [Amycolatopsis pretoriensis]SEF24780.1 Cellulose binding domain-containing protein [Amycolatopsis pretoriensis]